MKGEQIKCPCDDFCDMEKMLTNEINLNDGMFRITKKEAEQLCDFIEINIFDNIRDDTEIDNMSWLVLMIDLFERMADFCKYDGLTYSVKNNEVSE